MHVRYAFIFPGQGSQQVGMGKDLCARWPIARQTFAEANEVLDFDLVALCFHGQQQQLTMTENAQPAILTASIATLRILQEMGLEPAIVAGHSVGSFASLVAAESLSFPDAVRLVRQRGQLMASVQQRGTMLALVSAHSGQLAEPIEAAQTMFSLDVAANNSPTQTVFSGKAESIESFQKYVEPLSGVQARNFSVSHAFHSRLMAEKQAAWRKCLQSYAFRDARIPVGLNVSGQFATARELIIEDLINQFTKTVQWHSLYKQILEQRLSQVIEVGSGHTLAGLARAWRGSPAPASTENAAHILRLSKTVDSKEHVRGSLAA